MSHNGAPGKDGKCSAGRHGEMSPSGSPTTLPGGSAHREGRQAASASDRIVRDGGHPRNLGGRPPLGADCKIRTLNIRLIEAHHNAYLAAGGANWLRDILAAESRRQAATPSAHNPFPAFTVREH